MKWVEDSQATKDILAAISKEVRSTYPTRDGAPHVSELIYCLTRSWYNRVRPTAITEKEATLYLVGIGLERVLLRPYRQPLRGVVEGVAFEVDFIHLDEYVGEFKTTRYSSKRGPDELPQTWQKQILSYLYTKSRYLREPINTEARLAIFHLMGNYGDTRSPILMTWRGKATLDEVHENWDWIQGRKKVLEYHLAKGTPPRQFTYNEEWECEDCPIKMFCDAAHVIENLQRDGEGEQVGQPL